MIDVNKLLAPIAGAEPSGPNLEYDKGFAQLDRTAQGKPEQQVGKTIVPAEPPEWRAVVSQASQLLERTKDLRVAMHLVRGLVNTGGFAGFDEGLAVLRGLVERFWDTVHPQLDPDDDNDPTMRVNILAEINDASTIHAWLRVTPFVSARGLGAFSLRDYAVASGEITLPKDAPKIEMKTIEAAFSGAETSELKATSMHLRGAREHVVAIETAVTNKVGASNAPNFSKLRELIGQISKIVDKYLGMRPDAVAPSSPEPADNPAQDKGEASGAQAAVSQPPSKRLSGEISTREDVIRAIDMICEYYRRFEPSSPLPIFMERSKRLANMDFLGILRELAPKGLPDVQVLRGQVEEEKKEEKKK